MQVHCLEDKAFYELLDTVIAYVKANHQEKDRWVADEEAMRLLNIKSRTTLQNLRDEGKIRFSQPQKKIILYDRFSIESYLEKHAKDTF